MPGGALHLMRAGALDERRPRSSCSTATPRSTSAASGCARGRSPAPPTAWACGSPARGGHTSRPHLTEDLTFALGKVITELPAILSRRLDPRAGVSVVWGMVRAGSAHNVIPGAGQVGGTVRMLDAVAWADAEQLVRALIEQIVAPYGVHARGRLPARRAAGGQRPELDAARRAARSRGSWAPTGTSPPQQSLGGEDFGWYLDRVPGAMARLGTRTPGGPTYDLHQGNLRVDERAIGIGARVLAQAAVASTRGLGDPRPVRHRLDNNFVERPTLASERERPRV